MIYQIEEVKTGKRKLVIVYILILLLVLLFSVGLGIFTVKKIKSNEPKTKNEYYTKTAKNEQNNEPMIIITDTNKNTVNVDETKKADFYNIVENIYNGKEGKRVFLTFDDGPSSSVTPHVLDILKKYDIKATFFVLGNRVSSNSDLIKREYAEGHYIGNHGYSHKYSKIYSSSSKLMEEYNKTETEIRKALNDPNYASNLFRFPGGSVGGPYNSFKKGVKKEFKKRNIAYLDWNALTNDANGSNTKEKIMKSLEETVKGKNNVVVLMHDAPDKKITYETLEEVIIYLQKEGYKFKNIYDLIRMEE